MSRIQMSEVHSEEEPAFSGRHSSRDTGRDGGWDASKPQSTCLSGRSRILSEQGLVAANREIHLTNDELKASYVVIRHNVRTYESAGVVEVVKGRHERGINVEEFRSRTKLRGST